MALVKLKRVLGEGGVLVDDSHGANNLHDVLKALAQEVADLRTKFNNHTHRGDGAQVAQYNTSKPQSDTQTVAPVTASAVTQLLAIE